MQLCTYPENPKISRKNNGDSLEICIRKFIFPYISSAVWEVLWGMLVLNIFGSDFKLKMLVSLLAWTKAKCPSWDKTHPDPGESSLRWQCSRFPCWYFLNCCNELWLVKAPRKLIIIKKIALTISSCHTVKTNEKPDPSKPCSPTPFGPPIPVLRGGPLLLPPWLLWAPPCHFLSCWLSAELFAHLSQQQLSGGSQTTASQHNFGSFRAEMRAETILGRKGLCLSKARGRDKSSSLVPADSKKQL